MATSPAILMYYEHRREWLWHLIKERFNGNQAELARALNIKPGRINDYLRTRRIVGERFARRVEEALALPIGSLDHQVGWQEPRGDRRQPRAEAREPRTRRLTADAGRR